MPQTYVNECRLHYSDSGQGIPIIFIHPPLLTSLNFIYQFQPLSANFRTISFDIRGHGRSEPSKKAITYPLIVADIRQLMDQLAIEKAFLCGYSTGGSVMLEFLLAYPDRALGGIMISGMSEVSDWKLKNKISLGYIFSKLGAISTIALPVTWAHANTSLSLTRLLFNDAKKGYAKNVEQYYKYSLRYNCTAQLQNIPHPILLVYGTKDKQFHPYAKLLHNQLPNSRHVYIKNTRHQIPTKAATKLNALIDQFVRSF